MYMWCTCPKQALHDTSIIIRVGLLYITTILILCSFNCSPTYGGPIESAPYITLVIDWIECIAFTCGDLAW